MEFSTATGIYDDAGRYLAPAPVIFAARPDGPWNSNGAPLVSVCSWCPDAAEQTAAARAHGREVTHGLCPRCEAKMNAELDVLEGKRAA